MKRKSLTIGLAGLAGMALFGVIVAGTRHVPAHADTANYTNQKRQIRACVLVSSASQDKDTVTAGLAPSNTAPYVFYALDRPNDLKPAGIEFINPFAPQIITQDIYNRWQTRNDANNKNDRAFSVDSGGSPYPEATIFRVNAPVTKNMAAYWEMNLDNMSAADLQQFDVIMLPIHGSRSGNGGRVTFTSLEREKMRHYVDAGGTIWMETEGTNGFATDSFFIGVDTAPGPGANAFVNVVAGHHPLVNYPYLLTQQDANSLSLQTQMATEIFVGLQPQFMGGSARPLETALLPIINKGSNKYVTVWAGDYGAGHVVISSARIAGDINNLMLSGNPRGNAGSSVVTANDGAVSGDNLGGIPASDMKFGYNLISWISSVPAPGSNQRRTGSTQENIGSTLTTKWATIPITPANPLEPATVSNPGSGATIYKGMTFWVDGANIVHAYDVNPTQSLSGTNLADDGVPDLVYGSSYDEVWNDLKNRTLPDPGSARAATPTLVSQYDPNNGKTYELAVISTTNGGTYFFDAFPRNGNQLLPAASLAFKQTSGGDMKDGLDPIPSNNGGTPTPSAGLPFAQPYFKPVPAPAYSDGILFTLVFTNPKGTSGELGWRIAPVDVLASCRAGKALSVFNNGLAASADTQVAPNANWGGGLPGFYIPTGNLTVGEVKSTESDAIDRMVYVPIAANPNSKQRGEIRSVWFSTRNEPLYPDKGVYSPNGLRAHVPWYTGAGTGTINLLPIVHIVRHGDPNNLKAVTGVDTAFYKQDFDVSYPPDGGLNKVVVTFRNGSQVAAPSLTDEVFADFTVDWTGDIVGNIAQSAQPTQLEMELITGSRQFALYTPNFQQMTPESTGGITLSSLDNLIVSETNLHDMSQSGASGNPPLEDRVFSLRDQYLGQNVRAGTGPPVGAARRPTTAVNWMFSPTPARQFDASFSSGKFANHQVPARLLYNKNQPIYNFKAIGAPVTANGTVYVLGSGYLNPQGATSSATPDVGVLLALRENIDASLNIGPIAPVIPGMPPPFTLQQPSLLNPQAGITLNATDFTLEGVIDPITGAYTGVVHINNMQQGTAEGDTINTALPIFVVPNGANAGVGNQAAVPIINPKTGFGVLDNLQYYVAFPTARFASSQPDKSGFTPTSGPSISGSTLYFAADQPTKIGISSSVVSIDLIKAQQANGGTGQVTSLNFLSGTATLTDSDPKSANKGLPLAITSLATHSIHPPLGTTNVVMAPNAQGLVGLDNGLILIADSHRLLEVDAGGNAAWSMESTISQTSVGGNTLGTGGLAIKSIPLAQPTTSRRYSLNEFVVVDGGNNRVVGVNRGGTTRFEVSAFGDDMHFLRPGDPLTFNQPADVETFPEIYNNVSITNKNTNVTYTAQGAAPFTVTHYLVADSGNYRIVDIVDIVDSNGVTATMAASDGSPTFAAQKLLAFVTRSLGEQNEKYRYRTVQQFRFGATDYIIATISNNRQGNAGGAGILGNAGSNFDGPGGSLIAIQRSSNGPNPDPSKPNALSAGDVYNVINSIVVQDANGNLRRQDISNPTWFKEYSTLDVTNSAALTGPSQTPRFLMADANGCYILKIAQVTLNGVTSSEYVADWMLTAQDYYYMTGRKLQATCIQRETLSDLSTRNQFESRLLITNGYTGVDDISKNFTQKFGYRFQSSEPTTGEVFEIKADAYYPSVAKGNFYGYALPGYQRYQTNGINTSVITRMVPAEQATFNGANQLTGTKRRIGTADNSLSTYSLQQPQYAEKPL